MWQQREAARLRAMAEECRSVARQISLRKDAQLLEEMAERYEAQARALETWAKSSPAGGGATGT